MVVMSKRGRPRHPDILTPAEWRVVEGVRHGLTNPGIAGRCSLTNEAVKFHVSSVLGKLGLASRQELRRWNGVRADSLLAAAGTTDNQSNWTICQIARTTADLERTANWFRDVVGLTEVMRFEGMAFFECGGVRLYLSQGDSMINSLIYFRVANLHAEIERLGASGVTIRTAPHRIHVNADGSEEWIAFFDDLDGGPIGMMSVVRSDEGEKK